MAERTTVTNQDLETTGKIVPGGIYDNPLSDEGFKKLLGSRSSLTCFLNGVMHLDSEHEIDTLHFKTKRITYHVSDEEDKKKTWYFDIRARTRDGRNIDIEVQNLCHSFFSDRVLTYGSALMLKGKAELDKARADEDRKKMESRTPPELTKEEKKERRLQTYELPDTVCIWVCNFAIPEKSEDFWDNWMLYSGNELRKGSLLPITDRIKYIFIQLPNFKKAANELSSDEDQWIYILKHAFESTAEINIPNDAVTEALERLKSTSNSEDPDMITKEERECTIATIERDAELRGEARERQKSAETIAKLETKIKELERQLAQMS